MERKAFLKSCLVGLSSCAACGLGVPAGAEDGKQEASEQASNNKTIDAMRVRYATLVALIARHVPEDVQRTIFREMGRECARQFKAMTYEKFAGNLAGFLEEARGRSGWMASAEHDPKTGAITIVDRAKACTCPLVKQGLTPSAHCECTLGWQEETYSRILGQRVKASLVESILRGDGRCVFRVEVS